MSAQCVRRFATTTYEKSGLVQLTEFRLAYAPWPEIYVRDTVRILHFDSGKVSLSLAGNAFSIPNPGWSALEGESLEHLEQHYANPPQSRFQWTSSIRGEVLEREIAHFAEDSTTSIPMELFWEEGQPRLRVKGNLSSLLVWDNTQWFSFSGLNPNEVIHPLQGEILSDLRGIPMTLSTLFNYGEERLHASNLLYQVNTGSLGERLATVTTLQKRIREIGVFPRSLMVLALSEEEPLLRLEGDLQVTYSQVVWLVQLPFIPPPGAE